MFLFHGLSFDILEKKRRKQMGVTRLIIFQEGQINPTPQIPRIIQYKTSWSVVFFVIYITPYYLYEVILHYKAKTEKRKQFVISAHPGIDPGPRVPKSDTLTTW